MVQPNKQRQLQAHCVMTNVAISKTNGIATAWEIASFDIQDISPATAAVAAATTYAATNAPTSTVRLLWLLVLLEKQQ